MPQYGFTLYFCTQDKTGHAVLPLKEEYDPTKIHPWPTLCNHEGRRIAAAWAQHIPRPGWRVLSSVTSKISDRLLYLPQH